MEDGILRAMKKLWKWENTRVGKERVAGSSLKNLLIGAPGGLGR